MSETFDGNCEVITIQSWDHLLKEVRRFRPSQSPLLPRYLCRGQANADWKLIPSLLRLVHSSATAADAIRIEQNLLDVFMGQAHLSHQPGHLPATDNWLDWWALMRHHHAPTRLLDWTESAFVALYFAVAEQPDCDGAIWVTLPALLATHYGLESIDYRDMRKRCCDPNAQPGIRAFDAMLRSDRMVAQQGHFMSSVHILGDHATLIGTACDGMRQKRPFVRLIIPQVLKFAFFLELRAMNVTASSLFPGLDGLGRSLTEAAALESQMAEQRRLTGTAMIGGKPLDGKL